MEDELRAWAASMWPRVDWGSAEVRLGAFHRVALARSGEVLRAAVGQGHADRMAREFDIAVTVADLDLGVGVPGVLSHPIGNDSVTAMLVSRVDGSHGSDGDWTSDLGDQYGLLLHRFADLDTSQLGALPPVRTWCGGEEWPQVVKVVTASLSTRLRALAGQLVDRVLELDSPSGVSFVHGDFGPHNILWDRGRAVSLIDFDHACVADPAIDVAPLVGTYGARRLLDIVDRDLLDRAMHHRATLSLQVACAAHLIGADSLSEFAVDNFVRRAAQRTLYDPDGTTPSR